MFDYFLNGFWLPFGLQVGFKIDAKSKKIRLESIFEKTSAKIYLLRSKIDPPKIEKYSKTIGGLFKITLLAYPQRG